MKGEFTMTEYIKAWQCIGCGKVDVPQPPCIGVCQDRKVEFVYASEHEEALARAALALQRARTLEALVRRMAWTMPRNGEWERSYRVLQDQARQTLAALANEVPNLDRPVAAEGRTGAASVSYVWLETIFLF